MKIRTKLVVLASIMVAVYTMGLLGMLTILNSTRFLQAETAIAQADLDRAVKAIKRETESLGIVVRDYGRWDDTWNFARGDFPDYAEINLTDETWENTGLGFIAIYDSAGKCLYSRKKTDVGRNGPRENNPERLSDSPDLAEIISKGSGFLKSGPDLLLCNASAITKSSGSGQSAGSLIMGKNLDSGFFVKLSGQTGVPITFFPDYAALGLHSENFPLEGLFTRIDPSGKVLHAFKVFRLYDNTPAFILQTSTERSITSHGNDISWLIIIFSFGLAVIIAAILRFSFRAWVDQPLIRIEKVLEDLDLDRTGSGNPFFPGENQTDEIGHISSVLSGMYQRLGTAYDQIRQSNDTLEREVAIRTASLSAANRDLSLYGKILESTSEGVIITDLETNIIEVNDALCVMTGYPRKELIGGNPGILKSDRHDAEFYRALWSAIHANGHWSGEIWNKRQNGEIYPAWLTINTICNEAEQPEKFVGISTDISKIKDAESHLHQLAFYDPLTGLPNRSLFSDRLELAIVRARREKSRVGLLFLDLDRFKNINDTLGHAAGDCLLVKVASRIKSRVREMDTVCRIGGDEFTVILDKIRHDDDAGNIAGSIIQTISDKFDLNGTEIYAGASIGIAVFPKDGEDAATLVKKADTAMYAAKESGRGKWFFASGEMDEKTRHRMETESRLRGALRRNEFVLYYQAQTSAGGTEPGMSTGLLGAEALIRWIPENGVIIGPAGFIDIAEDIGLIVPLGAWVLAEACREAKKWADGGRPIQVSVNVSARQFEDGKLPETVAETLRETGLPPSLLKLEVTESMFMRNMEKVIDTISAIRQSGVMFSIDDFGTGYSSLQYLNRLPVDCLKIDKAFVSGMSDGLAGGEIVTAVISMARAFGLSSIAEGVETVDQLEALRLRGCDEIQGYLVSKPLPAAEFQKFITD